VCVCVCDGYTTTLMHFLLLFSIIIMLIIITTIISVTTGTYQNNFKHLYDIRCTHSVKQLHSGNDIFVVKNTGILYTVLL
jgi:hypothetical protein